MKPDETKYTPFEEVAMLGRQLSKLNKVIEDTKADFKIYHEKYEKLLEEFHSLSGTLSSAEESTRKLAVIVEDSNDAILLIGYDGRILQWNHGAEKIYGYSAKEMIGRNFFDIIPEDTKEESEAGFQRLMRGEVVPYAETKRVTKDGRILDVWLTNTVLRDNAGIPNAVSTTERDITERKRAEKRSSRLAAIVEYTDDAVLAMTLEGIITEWNNGAERLYGYMEKEMIGKSVSILMPSQLPHELQYILDKIMKGGHVDHFETARLRKDGSTVDVSLTASPIADVTGRLSGISWIARDITRLIQAENSLKKAYEEVDYLVQERTKELSRAISDLKHEVAERELAESLLADTKNRAELYLDLMGHDINNLNQIAIGYLEMAIDTIRQGGRIDESNLMLLEKPMETLQTTSRLISNVKKIKAAREGRYKSLKVNVGEMLEKVKGQYSGIPSRDITINYVQETNCYVIANELLMDVFLNIVGNAIKHSTGPLTVDIRLSNTEKEKNYCMVTIEDNGPGMTDQMKKNILDPACLSRTKAAGKGLGLCLTRMLIDDFHGKIWAEDRIPGDYTKGVKFVILLPTVEK